MYPPKFMSFLEPQKVILVGNRVVADVITQTHEDRRLSDADMGRDESSAVGQAKVCQGLLATTGSEEEVRKGSSRQISALF